MVRKSLLSIALLGLSAAAALAADPPAPQEKQRMVCRGGEKSLSSRIRTERRCRPADQWQQEDENSNRAPLSMQVTAGQNDGRATAAPR